MTLTHVTINTGNTTTSVREDANAAQVAALSRWIESGLSSRDPQPVPGRPGYTAALLHADSALICTVYGEHDGSPVPIVTIGVALESQDALRLWGMLVESANHVPRKLKTPKAPYSAAVVHDGSIAFLSALKWTGDLELNLAWAWMGLR